MSFLEFCKEYFLFIEVAFALLAVIIFTYTLMKNSKIKTDELDKDECIKIRNNKIVWLILDSLLMLFCIPGVLYVLEINAEQEETDLLFDLLTGGMVSGVLELFKIVVVLGLIAYSTFVIVAAVFHVKALVKTVKKLKSLESVQDN